MALPVMMWLAVFVLITAVMTVDTHFVNEWAVQIDTADDDQLADKIAAQLGCVNKGKVFDDTYLFLHSGISRRSAEPHLDTHAQVTGHPQVRWAEQQKVLSRKKRQLWRLPAPPIPEAPSSYEDVMHLNDERWPQMWYLNRGQHLDMNVQPAWAEGVTGKGISITILDDGIERSHPDLMANYDPLASYDVNDNDNDPSPRYDLVDSNRHGTRCAGEVAATANNSECAVGIAYEAGIGGVRMLDGDVTDAVEARSLGLNNQHVHIYSASWGPDDDGKTVDGPGRLASRAFMQGISEGRGGKGSIFVWASGNGGRDHDNCNCDGYTNSIWTLSVSSATENGLIPWYSEACSSTLATTYSSGSSGERKVVTTDLHHMCTSSHTGTSASAPLAAGIIALTLQVNPELTWRDVQHLTIRCAHVANLRANDWSVNALGRNFSHAYGYGIMDASCMVQLARSWKTVPKQESCMKTSDHTDLLVPGRSVSKTKMEVSSCDNVKFLEHVRVHVTLAATKRGDVRIFVVSPSGTRSNLLAKRPRDYSRAGFNDWPFLTVHMWEESPIGTWTLEVENNGRSIVQLKDWRLAFLGTKEAPQPDVKIPKVKPPPSTSKEPAVVGHPEVASPKPTMGASTPKVQTEQEPSPQDQKSAFLPEHCLEQLSPEWCGRCQYGYYLYLGRCVENCPVDGFFRGLSGGADACLQCYYSCRTCRGPNDYECLTCYGDAQLDIESPMQQFCHNKSLIARVFSSSRWYYVLSFGFVVNFAVVVILIIYILRWSRDGGSSIREAMPILPGKISSTIQHSARKMSGSAGGSRYSPVKTLSPASSALDNKQSEVTLPYRDYESSSEDEELIFSKPYTDKEPV